MYEGKLSLKVCDWDVFPPTDRKMNDSTQTHVTLAVSQKPDQHKHSTVKK